MIKNIRKRFGRTARWLKNDLTVCWFLAHSSGGYRLWVGPDGRMFFAARSPGITLDMEELDFDSFVSETHRLIKWELERRQKDHTFKSRVPEQLDQLITRLYVTGEKFIYSHVRKVLAEIVNGYYSEKGIPATVG